MRDVTYATSLALSSFSFASCILLLIESGVAPPLDSARSLLGAFAYRIAQSRAVCSNSVLFRSSMLATSASWGSFGSGVLRRDCREIRADLIVRTGDHADDRVSKQIAPYASPQSVTLEHYNHVACAYGLTADVGMPDLGLELHHGRPERVLCWYLYVNPVPSALIWSIWWAEKLAPKMRQVIRNYRFDQYPGVRVVLDIGDFLGDTASATGAHCAKVRR